MVWAFFLKAIYSALIFCVMLFLFRELVLVWFDSRVYIGKFDVVSNISTENPDSVKFAQRVVASQAILAQQLQTYQQVADLSAQTDDTYSLFPDQKLSLPQDALKGVDITVQNVNLTAIFTALRRGFTSPNEVSGSVTSTPGSVLAAIQWPKAPKPALASAERLNQFFVPSQSSYDSAAAYIACSLSWARGAAQSEALASIPRDQFCGFSSALNVLYSLGEKAHVPKALKDDDIALIRRKTDILSSYKSIAPKLPDIYRLRADLFDLLPDDNRRQSDLVEAQEDRLSYALLSPIFENKTDEEKRFQVLAFARPAIILKNGEPDKAPHNWTSILARYNENVRRSALSTGIVFVNTETNATDATIDGRHPLGTAFMVAPNLAITASHVLEGASYHTKDKDRSPRLAICFEDDPSKCSEFFRVSDIHYQSSVGDTDIALIEVEDHSPVFHPPLPLAEPSPLQGSLVGSYAFVVGYPFADPRMPTEFTTALFAGLMDKDNDRLLDATAENSNEKSGTLPVIQNILNFFTITQKPNEEIQAEAEVEPDPTDPQQQPILNSGVRRLMPGRLLAFNNVQGRFTSDISTTGGTSGAALTDFATGEVLGVSLAGRWQGERGKFSFSSPIPKEVREMINRRLAERPIADEPEVPSEPLGASDSPEPEAEETESHL